MFRRRRRERADHRGSKADGTPDERDFADQDLVLADEGAGPADDEVLMTVEEAGGRFGPELRARVTSAEAGPGARPGAVQPVRFLGVDGPRWFLRGVIAGPAAHHRSAAEPLEDVFAGIVVVRGDHPAPPRDLLEIRLPEQARQAMEEQMAEEDAAPAFPNPFERGPEITETR